MNVSDVIVLDNSLKMKVCCDLKERKELISPKYKINFIEYQLKVFYNTNGNAWYLLIKLKKCVDDDIWYHFKVISIDLKINKTFISDDSDWRVLACYSATSSYTYQFDIEIKVDVITSFHVRLSDHDPSFKIKGIDGSISVHECVLVEASEVFEKMISDFKEKKEARIELPYSICVLQDLKEYLYYNKLNNDNLENLLMLAHCYMIYELKRKCIQMLFFNTTTKKNLKHNQDVKRGERQIKE